MHVLLSAGLWKTPREGCQSVPGISSSKFKTRSRCSWNYIPNSSSWLPLQERDRRQKKEAEKNPAPDRFESFVDASRCIIDTKGQKVECLLVFLSILSRVPPSLLVYFLLSESSIWHAEAPEPAGKDDWSHWQRGKLSGEILVLSHGQRQCRLN